MSSLLAQSLRRDLVSDEEFERWFTQLGTNIWRGESYLDSEFKKLVKAVLVLKRKDISANILKNYLKMDYFIIDKMKFMIAANGSSYWTGTTTQIDGVAQMKK